MNRFGVALAIAVLVVFAEGASAQSVSPYAGQERRQIKALSEQDVADLKEGRGMGLAKAAELNSYPGPQHVLELAPELGLTDAQRAATRWIQATMRERAQALGIKIIEAEDDLDWAFANATIAATDLRSKVAAIAALQGELRVVHLEAHLAQRSVLTPPQVAKYDALRGYRANATTPLDHGRGH
jgi:hypothetical protein